ncbi:tyrosine-type recombinase/integrase [Paenibacillus terrigena]|uniref:tyrosine-type recombinase/integrase n=1 Tax=Paenibacillus terrigena TaxID=369333 RepID=UPI0028D41F63|nr:tyrosine-type recombinase/integrase [Paenibacillus terrigena]
MARRRNQISQEQLHPQRPVIHNIDDFDSALHLFLRESKVRNLSEFTTRYYRQQLELFRKHLERQQQPTNPAKITDAMIKENIILYMMDRGNKEKTINTLLRAVRTFFNYLVNESYLLRNPMENVKLLKHKKTIIQTFTREQIHSLLAQPNRGTFVGLRNYTIILLFIETGVRAKELENIRMDDIKWNENLILIREGKGYKERHVPIQATMKRELQKYVNLRGQLDIDILFVNIDNGPLAKRQIQQMMNEYGKAANITNVRCSPHTLRHTFAKMSVQNGANVFALQAVLGHTSLDMVRNYVNMFSSDVLEAHRKFSPVEKLF